MYDVEAFESCGAEILLTFTEKDVSRNNGVVNAVRFEF